MYIAICDDDNNYINTIEDYITALAKTETVCDAYQSGEELVGAYKSGERYDVIFLDMEMSGMNGIETADKIRETDEHVIIVFVTSHTKYMQESFKCSPFRFLLKPVERAEFAAVFADILKKLAKRRMVFTFNENKSLIRLYCDEIIYCESSNHWVFIHTKDRTYKVCKSISEVYDALDKEMLFRVHRSFIVNFKYVREIKSDTIRLYHTDAVIPIGRQYKRNVLSDYTDFVERNLYV